MRKLAQCFTVSMKITRDLRDRLEDAAKSRNTTKTEIMRMAVEQWLDSVQTVPK